MKSLGAPRPWPPEMCDELRQHLGRYSQFSKTENVAGGLFALLYELEGWLKDARPYGKKINRAEEWASIVNDVNSAFGHVGPILEVLVPSASDFLRKLDADLGVDSGRRASLVPVIKQIVAELASPELAGAAFVDIVEAVKDPETRTEVIEGRVDVLDSVLRFGGRSLGSVSPGLRGIVDNHARTINAVRTELDGVEMIESDHHDADAGLSEDARIALAKRWTEHVPAPKHHVVWVFYQYARGLGWRFTVGPCEFFDGSALKHALREIDEIRDAGGEYPGNRDPFNIPPFELIADSAAGRYLRDELQWPSGDDWIAVRVDLGVGTFPHLEETARDQVRAQVALASIDIGRTSWTELTGYHSFVDGSRVTSSIPFEEPDFGRKFSAADHTADWLYENREGLGKHLATGPHAHAVVAAASTLAQIKYATPPLALLEAVRVVETLGSLLQVTHWKELVRQFATAASSLSRARVEAFRVIESASRDLELLEHLPDLRKAPEEFSSHIDNRQLFNLASAVKRLPDLVAKVPTHNRSSRRLRETADDLATPTKIAKFVAAQTARDERLLQRAHRVRNSLMHGGPTNCSVVASSAKYVRGQAEHLTSVTLRALLDGKAPVEALRKYRRDNGRSTKLLSQASTNVGALFPGAGNDEQHA